MRVGCMGLEYAALAQLARYRSARKESVLQSRTPHLIADGNRYEADAALAQPQLQHGCHHLRMTLLRIFRNSCSARSAVHDGRPCWVGNQAFMGSL